MMTPIRERNVFLCVVLSIVTLGIYGLIWFVSITDDMKKASGHENLSGGMAVVLSLITCGIYSYFWAWNMGKANNAAKMRHGIRSNSDDHVLYLILQFLGLSWITNILVQGDLNKYAQIEKMNLNNQSNFGYQMNYR